MLKTLDQALKILLKFTKEKPSWGVRGLARDTDTNEANIYRILATLEANRFLVKDPETKKYYLGIRLWELGVTMQHSLHVGDLLKPVMQRLMEETGESVFLTSLVDGEGLTLEVLEPDHSVKFSVSIGSRAPLYVGASYRTMLAFLPEEEVERLIGGELVRYTSKTLVDSSAIRRDLATIRDKGWGRSDGEYTPDVVALAVPLFGYGGQIAGSLTVSGPTYRLPDSKIDRIVDALLRAKAEMNDLLLTYRIDLSRYFK
ncbi:IclR family transcriptional regulator [Paenibacillus sp. MSJ-34]|uniref:IclR family transcriptional regulator n=1 Tax=Paenibacillus sp. MSJ-34 TaxID=2841529 RepID=UPI001C0FFED3|nr:IclR family transcriptional regulator [Paenibacillus sp. MSJ-34]